MERFFHTQDEIPLTFMSYAAARNKRARNQCNA